MLFHFVGGAVMSWKPQVSFELARSVLEQQYGLFPETIETLPGYDDAVRK